MGELDPKPRPARALVRTCVAFVLAQVGFWIVDATGAADKLHSWWWRGHREWPEGTIAFRVLDRLGHALKEVFPDALFSSLTAMMLVVPLALLVRTLARARLRAGNADPLDRVRTWTAAHPRWTRALVASLPVAWALDASRGAEGFLGDTTKLPETLWVSSIWVVVSAIAALALYTLVRKGADALLAPTLAPTKRAAVAKDEITFDAVAVTRETRAAVGGMAATSVAMMAWVCTLSTHALYHGSHIGTAVALYALFALGGTLVFLRASKIAVGLDGVLVKGTSRTQFFAYRDLDAARVDSGDLELVQGERVVLRIQLHGEDAARRDEVLARIRDAIDRVKEGRGAVAAQLVSSASAGELARAAGGGADYRGASLTREQLWALIEGPEIESSARRAAAEALSKGIDSEERMRLRVAAEHCAAPEVRVALERLAEIETEDGGAEGAGLARRSA